MKIYKFRLLALISLIIPSLIPQIAFAQGAPPATPIDGGLSLLLAGGLAYGLKKIVKKN